MVVDLFRFMFLEDDDDDDEEEEEASSQHINVRKECKWKENFGTLWQSEKKTGTKIELNRKSCRLSFLTHALTLSSTHFQCLH